MIVSNCLNCDTCLEQSFEFCPTCSQKVETHRLTMHEIGHEVLHAATHADKGILFLLKELVVNPGRVIREYTQGKRKKYFNPFSFLLIVVGVYVFSNQIFHTFDQELKHTAPPPQATTSPAHVQITPAQIRAQKAKKLKLMEVGKRVGKVQHFMNTKTNVILFISTPFFAFVLSGLFRKPKKYYAEHLVAMVFIVSLLSLATTFIFGPVIYFTKQYNMYYVWLLIMMLFHITYIALSYHGWMEYPKSFRSYAICWLKAWVALLCWTAAVSVGIMIYIITGF